MSAGAGFVLGVLAGCWAVGYVRHLRLALFGVRVGVAEMAAEGRRAPRVSVLCATVVCAALAALWPVVTGRARVRQWRARRRARASDLTRFLRG